MDDQYDLIAEFLAETNESVARLDNQLIELERQPDNPPLINEIFRLVHTIKGTCGFIGLSRLEKLAHASENVLGLFRSGEAVATPEAVTVILRAFDRIKDLLAGLGETGKEPAGDDRILIKALDALAAQATNPMRAEPEIVFAGDDDLMADLAHAGDATDAAPSEASEAERADAAGEVPAVAAPGGEATLAATVAEATVASVAPAAIAKRADAPADKPATARDDHAAEEPAATAPAVEARPDAAPQTVRVSVELLDKLMTLVGELVLARNQILQVTRAQQNSDLTAPVQGISHVTTELQESVMKTRMQPVGNAWGKLPRIVRDLAHELGKKIDLVMTGAETEIDRQVLELIKDPLTHMIRNCCDHALETPAERRAAGKPETGVIRLSASHQGGHIVIAISDDGRGIDTKRVLAKALERGLIGPAEAAGLAPAQIREFIFHPGFSTAAKVTNVSGRGVGMDVVKTNVEKIGGRVEVDSEEGKGSTFSIKIPLTLAIVSALIVECARQRYALPQLSVVEIVLVGPDAPHRIERIKDSQILRLRERILPLVSLAGILGLSGGGQEERGNVLVCQVGADAFGIVVDGVFDTEEIVVKPLSPVLKEIPVFSGNTILGDGSVVMILDPNGIVADTGVGSGRKSAAPTAKADDEAKRDTTQLLLFRAGAGAPKAVPLGVVARLEQIETSRIEILGNQAVVQYLDKLMPIVGFDGATPQPQGDVQQLIVFIDGDRAMGLAVDEIVEIVDSEVRIDLHDDRPGIIGGAIIEGKATDVVDISHYLRLAFGNWFRRDEDAAFGEIATGVSGKRVLVADDSAFFRGILGALLRARGYGVVEAHDAQGALDVLAADQAFDCVLSDIEMPGMNGFEFAQRVKGNPETAHLPMIALTSHDTPKDVERGIASGFAAFVGKFEREKLFDTLAAIKN